MFTGPRGLVTAPNRRDRLQREQRTSSEDGDGDFGEDGPRIGDVCCEVAAERLALDERNFGKVDGLLSW